MTDTKTKTQIKILEARLQEEGFDAKIWKDRIYLNEYGKDIKAYITFDAPFEECEEDIMAGTKVNVYTNAVNVDSKWIINRRKQVLHTIAEELYATDIINVEPPKDWRNMII